jgi:hypothetical protein
LIEDEVARELKESLAGHGLDVENFYLSSLTPIEGGQLTENTTETIQPIELKTNTDLGARF